MKKGVMRREQILAEAEALFYEQGYEQTSIQALLDLLDLSKGGFYHHFESKQALLEAICEARAQTIAQEAEAAVLACGGHITDSLNAILRQAGLWREDSVQGLSLQLKAAGQPDGNDRLRKVRWEKTRECLLPLLNHWIRRGLQEGVFFLPHADLAGSLVLRLCELLSMEFARLLTLEGAQGNLLAEMLDWLELYRHAIERLLGAPYGSVVLCDLGKLQAAADALGRQ